MTLWSSMCRSFYCTNECSVSSKHNTGNYMAYSGFLYKGFTEPISSLGIVGISNVHAPF